jgi:FMN phosphatase YigB (HAD superfamily)
LINSIWDGTFPCAIGRGRDGEQVTRAAITFDFHNTIAQCDEWFDIEVSGLVSAFLRWQSNDRGIPVDTDTLWSADQAYRELRRRVREHGNELTAEECVATVLDELTLLYDDREITRGVEHLMRPAVALAQPMAGAIETINELANVGIPLGVVSSAVYHPFLLWTLDQFGVVEAFETITTSASAGFYKSRPEIYFTALTALNATAERSVHVGDSLMYDVGGAQRAGMRTVLLEKSHQKASTNPKPDLTLPSLVDSAPRILGLLNEQTEASGISLLGAL